MNKKKFYKFIILIAIFNYFSNNTIKFDSFTNVLYFPIKNSYVITSNFGYRKLYGKENFHNGIDIASIAGTPVYSVCNGTVSKVAFDKNGYGNYILITSNNGYKYLYGHLDNITVSPGNYIAANSKIAEIGPKVLSNGLQNGNTTGPHLHFTTFDSNNVLINPLSQSFSTTT